MDDARPATQVFALPPSLLEPKNTLWAKHKYLFNPRPSGLPSFKDAEEDIDRFQSESEEPVTRDNEYLGIHPRRARAKFIYEDRQRYREARQREKQGLDHDQALLLEWAFTGGAIDEKTRRATLRRRDKTKAPAVQRITMMATMPPAEIWKYKQVLRIEVARLARRTEEEARLKENEVQGLEEEVPRLEADCAREEADCAQEKARAQNEAHAREEVRVDTQRPNVMRRPRSEQPMREDDEEELERRRRRRSRENAQRERDGRSRGREGEDPRRGRGRLLVQRLSESYY
ncbi:hypothetical protein BD626DRAFT_515493 [Schizophyllum amplum]|uniref:Uncharacterized protein n=1 Tax=Schizophyllum amplum TaxID=97359 RepID=A0A550BXJ7_9AGAR|nr:hypothetical protein BD626DRAFT_515493 [Auriculariopsis ampla]